MEIACKQENMEDTFRRCCRFTVFFKIVLSFLSPKPGFLAFLPSSGKLLCCLGQGMLFPKRCVRTGCCNQLETYWYWREQEGLHGLVFVFFFFSSTAQQLWCTFTQPLIHCDTLTLFNKTSSPHLVFVQLIIHPSNWNFTCGAICSFRSFLHFDQFILIQIHSILKVQDQGRPLCRFYLLKPQFSWIR